MVIDSLLLGDFVGAWRSKETSPPEGKLRGPRWGAARICPLLPGAPVCVHGVCAGSPQGLCVTHGSGTARWGVIRVRGPCGS